MEFKLLLDPLKAKIHPSEIFQKMKKLIFFVQKKSTIVQKLAKNCKKSRDNKLDFESVINVLPVKQILN